MCKKTGAHGGCMTLPSRRKWFQALTRSLPFNGTSAVLYSSSSKSFSHTVYSV